MTTIDTTSSTTRAAWFRWVVFGTVAITYMLIFTQRTGPGIVSNQIQAQFSVSSALLGTMASIQFFLYMVLQVPVGLFGDKFGPEKLLISGTVLDGLGTVVFSQAHGFSWLLVGRALVGAGDALIWVNIVLIVGKWFSSREFGAVLGMTGTFGNLGALCATIPFASWIALAGWRFPFLVLGLALLVTAGWNVFVWMYASAGSRQAKGSIDTRPLLSDGVHVTHEPIRSVWQTLGEVLTERLSWAGFLCHFGVMGSYLGFTGLWAVPYFMNVYGVSREGAAEFILAGFIGAIFGGPVMGYVSDKVGQRRFPYIAIQATTGLGWLVFAVISGVLPMWLSYVALFVLGFGCGGSMLTFASIRDVTPAHKSGVTSGFANTGGFLSAVLFPIAFGAVIDWMNPTQQPGPTAQVAFHTAFLIPTLFSLLGVVGSWMLPKRKISYDA